MNKVILFIFIILSVFGVAQVSPQTFSVAGTGAFTVPCGVTSITIECWGGGGGGGGAYARYNSIAVTPGVSYNYTVGAGGAGGASGAVTTAAANDGKASQIIIGATTYSASGGTRGTRAASGAGGAGGVVSAGASVSFAGGNGATGVSGTRSGGGGEGASAAGIGNNATTNTGATGNATGGDGGNGSTNNNGSGVAGSAIGGGGGGGNGTGTGAAGARGQIVISYGAVTTPANAGTDQTITCSVTTATLAGNSVSGTTGAWSCITNCGGVTIVTPSSPTSQVTGLTVGTSTTLRWTITGAGPCSTSDDVVLTPTASCPPVNDDPTGAIPLVVGATCSITTVTNLNATSTTCGTIPNPSCGSYVGGDVWFTVTVPATGVVNFSSALGTNTDPQIAVYSGSPCGVMTEVGCDDDSGLGLAFALSISGRTPGEVLYVRCWRYNTTTGGTFDICVTDMSCPAALTIVVDDPLVCGQNTQNSLASAGECKSYATDISQTKYYRFVATNDSIIVNLDILTNPSATAPITRVLGPFAPGQGCSTGCTNLVAGSAVSLPASSNEFGYHGLLTGLSTTPGNNEYLIQVEGNNNRDIGYCISVATPEYNITKDVPSVINNCGVTFNGTTAQNYYASSTKNLDGNNATSCSVCAAQEDVPFAINNASWFKVCSTNTGTYNVQFDVGSCLFTTAPGVQMAILTGSVNNFTNIWMATNPTLPSTPVQTSPNFSLAAGACAYLIVDGWNGDECSYSYVLTNVAGGCVLLPVELLSFNALAKEDYVDITWATASEKNNAFFNIEKSVDGVNFESIEQVKGQGSRTNAMFYSSQDRKPTSGLSYYRIKQTDYDGQFTYSKIVSVNYDGKGSSNFEIIPNPTSNDGETVVKLNSSNNDVEVTISDINGLEVYRSQEKTNTGLINIPSGFSKGVYIIKITSKDFSQTKRMIIK